MRCRSCVIALLAVPGLPAAGLPVSALDADDPQAFMDEVLARYRDAETYTHVATHEMKLEFEGMDPNAMLGGPGNLEVTFAARRPGSFAIVGAEMLDLYANAGVTTVHMGDIDTFVRLDGVDSLSDVPAPYGSMISSENPVVSLVLERPAAFGGPSFPVGGWDEIAAFDFEGRAGHTVSGTIPPPMPGGPSMPISVWVDAETGLIGQVEYDILELVKMSVPDDMPPGMESPTPTLAKRILTYREVTIDAPIDDARFAFVPGPDDELAERVPTFEEIAQALYGEPGDAPAGPGAGDAAPAFATTTIDGDPISLAGLAGKAVLIDFWATWCMPCLQAMPKIQGLHERYADDGLVVIGVSVDAPNAEARMRTVLDDLSVTFPQVHDTDESIADSYGVSAIPHSVLIDPDGTVRAVHIGFAPGMEAQYAREIEQALASDDPGSDS